jgi:hypothetical protein
VVITALPPDLPEWLGWVAYMSQLTEGSVAWVCATVMLLSVLRFARFCLKLKYADKIQQI